MFVHEKYHGVFHGKAINLARKLCQEYDNAFERYDALVLPTIIKKTPKIPDEDNIDFGKLRTKGMFSRVSRGICWLFFRDLDLVECILWQGVFVCVGIEID